MCVIGDFLKGCFGNFHAGCLQEDFFKRVYLMIFLEGGDFLAEFP